MEEIRLKKLQELREKGINPYPYRFEISDFIGNIRKQYEEEPPENYKVKVMPYSFSFCVRFLSN